MWRGEAAQRGEVAGLERLCFQHRKSIPPVISKLCFIKNVISTELLFANPVEGVDIWSCIKASGVIPKP